MSPEAFFGGLGEMVTIVDCIRYGASSFNEAQLHYGHGTDNAVDEANLLVLHALGVGRSQLAGAGIPTEFYQARVSERERQVVGALLWRRIDERRPAAYLIGSAWFAGHEFLVDERALVPRSPFAELIENAFAPWLDCDDVGRVLDIGTGSGCIALAIAHALPWAEVVAADIDADARALAQANVDAHGLTERVTVVHSDVLDEVQGWFDLIVSNPPYVPSDAYLGLASEYHCEPRLGLEAGTDGLDVVRRILTQAPSHLAPHGNLIIEVGEACSAFEAAFVDLDYVWLDDSLERGGEGLALIHAEALAAWCSEG